ncbi:Uncharacterised protein [uncultured archaeon]|nr:Uncharacterised protein [uncultured archaeon]
MLTLVLVTFVLSGCNVAWPTTFIESPGFPTLAFNISVRVINLTVTFTSVELETPAVSSVIILNE